MITLNSADLHQVVIFWLLDSYYLQHERRFRILYKQVGVRDEPDFLYSIKAPDSNNGDRTLYPLAAKPTGGKKASCQESCLTMLR